MVDKIVGREDEVSILGDIFHSSKAEFVAVYGRRRIGKTYLINTFFEAQESRIYFSSTGEKDAPLLTQLGHFTERMGEVFFSGVAPNKSKSWDEAFQKLTTAISHCPPNQKIVLFFDELPWMATKNSRLLQSLQYYWNQYWSHDERIKLIICGSSASWIIKKVINDKGGLHNRITQRIHLMPFDLLEVKQFLLSKKIKLSNYQIVQLYMATGGVPYYLASLAPGKSAAQFIEQLAFKKGGLLLDEFDKLLASLFSDADVYAEILKIVASKREGFSASEIAANSNMLSKGGELTKKLKDLCDAGFLMSFKPLYSKKRGVYYKVSDEYTHFYFHWVEPIASALSEASFEPGYWQALQLTPKWTSWSGYAFESLCYKHISKIRRALEIPVTALASSWRYSPHKPEEQGAQIDLIFDRLDDTVSVIEIKFSNDLFVIDKAVAHNLRNKLSVFKKQTRTKKQLLVSMVAANGLAENLYADDLISGIVTLEDFFKE